MKNKWLLLFVLLLPLFSGCNDTDDVQKIFTGKTWKLSVIKFAGSDKECKDYWLNANGTFNQESFEQSNKRLMEADTFTLTFSGTTKEDEISGKANGKAYTITISEVNWKANGVNNDFSIAVKATNDKDVLGTAFLKALANATSYSGDENNLYIYFTEGQQNKYLAFHVAK